MIENHIVSAFDRDLAELNDMVARLGVRAGEQFAAALSTGTAKRLAD